MMKEDKKRGQRGGDERKKGDNSVNFLVGRKTGCEADIGKMIMAEMNDSRLRNRHKKSIVVGRVTKIK